RTPPPPKMVNPVSRMRKLQGRLALVRNGFGAAILPPDVKKFTLLLAYRLNDGHRGPRKFWRVCMPRLKYHNPDIQMDVVRKEQIGGPSHLTVEFDGKPEVRIECKHKNENDIVNELFKITGAKQLPIDPQDSELAADYLRDKEKRIEGKINLKITRAARKEEARLLGSTF
ncbi:hypothetical protein EX30DRAFT_303950, partial [Ascodesmis nigricans]